MAASVPIPSGNDAIHDSLIERRQRLQHVCGHDHSGEARRLLADVDAALERLRTDCYGTCEVCGSAIEAESLSADPLRTVCLDCLSTVQKRSLEADLELAVEIQNGLLTSGEFVCDGWSGFIHSRPAGTVGGDFVDLAPVTGGGAGFVLGDVSGKGVSAALLGAHLQALVRSSSSVPGALAERAGAVNRLFSAVAPPQSFATLVWGVIDGNGRGELVNAGHLPAVIVGRNGCATLDSTGIPMGLFAGVEYRSTRFELAPGEQILLFTDGVTESSDEKDREYGFESLWSLVSESDLDLSPAEAVGRYLRDVARHRGGLAQQDDLTLMVLRRDCCGRVEASASGSASVDRGSDRVGDQRLISSSL